MLDTCNLHFHAMTEFSIEFGSGKWKKINDRKLPSVIKLN